jgi:hypothetical protein
MFCTVFPGLLLRISSD